MKKAHQGFFHCVQVVPYILFSAYNNTERDFKVYKRTILSVAVVFLMLLGMVPAQAAEFRVTNVSAGATSMTATVQGGGVDKIGYMVYDTYSLVCEGEVTYDGRASVTLNVPTQWLKSGEYKVSVWGITGAKSGKIFSYDVLAGSWNGSLTINNSWLTAIYSQQEKDYMTAIKTPQAVVYADSGMATRKASLKRNDRIFFFPTSNPLIYYISSRVIVGNEIKVIETANGYDQVGNWETLEGYIWANSVKSTTYKENAVKEVLNLALTRLGKNGIYTQVTGIGNRLIGRWGPYSQDCSSFVYWVFKENGINIGGITADAQAIIRAMLPNGIRPYLAPRAEDEIKPFNWTTKHITRDSLGYEHILAIPELNYIKTEESFADYYYNTKSKTVLAITMGHVDPNDSIVGTIEMVGIASGPGNIMGSVSVYKQPTITQIKQIQPGDTLYWNHFENITVWVQIGLSTFMGIHESGQIREDGGLGVDHTGIYIGGDQYEYIHASGKGSNTIISPLEGSMHGLILVGRVV
jgi:hypothetical protein